MHAPVAAADIDARARHVPSQERRDAVALPEADLEPRAVRLGAAGVGIAGRVGVLVRLDLRDRARGYEHRDALDDRIHALARRAAQRGLGERERPAALGAAEDRQELAERRFAAAAGPGAREAGRPRQAAPRPIADKARRLARRELDIGEGADDLLHGALLSARAPPARA